MATAWLKPLRRSTTLPGSSTAGAHEQWGRGVFQRQFDSLANEKGRNLERLSVISIETPVLDVHHGATSKRNHNFEVYCCSQRVILGGID